MIADAPCATDAVVLAAGLSRRTFPRHKLLARDANGRPMIATTIRRIQASTVRRIIIVLGHRADEVHDAIMPWLDAHRPLPHLIHAPDHARGLSASLRAGIEAAQAGRANAALICLADMPLVPTGLLDRMIAAHAACHPSAVTVMHGGRRGHPVLWDRRMFPDLLRIDGDRGARDLLRRMGHGLLQLEAGPEIHEDFDTPARLERFSTLSPVS
ncbi:NTP transferase domain-containing protein [Komagataeibacter sp. FXV2]|nr:NTP transferase domain-containing protein [Komagataeibacter sp. FXV2]